MNLQACRAQISGTCAFAAGFRRPRALASHSGSHAENHDICRPEEHHFRKLQHNRRYGGRARADGSMVLIGMGPDADRRAKLLIYQAMVGAILDAYLQTSTVAS